MASTCQTVLRIVLIALVLPMYAEAAQSSESSKTVTVPLSKAVEQAAPESAKQIQVVVIKGPISRKLFSNLRQLLNQPYVMADKALAGEEFIPGKLIVLLDSRGGDGMAAMDIGRILRQANAHVFVTGECSSACVFLLASGVVRGAPTFTVGIHQARITMSSDAGVIKREVDVQDEPKAKALLVQFEKDAKIYLAEMGLPSDFFQAMQNHSAKGLYRLTGEEIVFYGLSGFDDVYFDKRAQFFAKQQGKWALDKDTLHSRTAKVASECAPYEQQQQEFVNCYKRVLSEKY